MIYREMPTGEKLSLLGFGIMRLPVIERNGVEDIDQAASTQMIDYALKHGVNYFDTAWPYHEGESESFLGTALVDRYDRDSFYLATKLPVWEIDSPVQADALFAKQLAKLRTDYIDFYLMHALDGERLDHILENGLLQWAIDLQKAGAIKRLGFSFHGTLDELERIIAAHSWDFGQLQLNYLDWELQKAGQAYQMLTDANTPVIVMEPMRGGRLAELTPAATEILTDIHPDRSTASWGFRYLGGLKNVVCILSGMTAMDQLEDNVATFSMAESDLSLSEHEGIVLDAALKTSNLAAAIPCTDCKYCMPCMYGIDIARVFGAYNQYKVSGAAFAYKMGLKAIGERAQAKFCIDCRMCTPKCPQRIDIPAKLSMIAKETAELLSVDEMRAERAELIVQREQQSKDT
ncbi:MAG: aldo/keto reductase [Coriobacteriia bacterium]|nr:aldo/keto reductase [Coriobacteriia bacterium]